MRAWKGSLTIEAALIIPLVMSVFVYAIHVGIDMHLEVRETAQQIMEEEDYQAANAFRMWKKVGEMITDED